MNPSMVPFRNPPSLNQQSAAECQPLVLDLCIKKKPISPDYNLIYSSPKQSPTYGETQTSLYYPSPKSISECSETSESSNLSDFTGDVTASPTSSFKTTRPFKAFPKNPLSLSLDLITTTGPFLDTDYAAAYEEFRQRMLAHVRPNYAGINKNMRRIQNHYEKTRDPNYLEKRRKNNEAAKRSRDARRAKEDEIAVRCAFLEQENMMLRFRLAALKGERVRLQTIV